jgi:Tfp pilus assembly PilM family ATPase
MINIISNGIIEFSRPVSYGSRDLDTAIAGYFDIPADKAEQKKIQELKIDRNMQIDAQQGIMQAVISITIIS